MPANSRLIATTSYMLLMSKCMKEKEKSTTLKYNKGTWILQAATEVIYQANLQNSSRPVKVTRSDSNKPGAKRYLIQRRSRWWGIPLIPALGRQSEGSL